MIDKFFVFFFWFVVFCLELKNNVFFLFEINVIFEGGVYFKIVKIIW